MSENSKRVCDNCTYFAYQGVEKDENGEWVLEPVCILSKRNIDKDSTCKDWTEINDIHRYSC